MMSRSFLTLFIALVVASSASAFCIAPQTQKTTALNAVQRPHKLVEIATTAAIAFSTSPLAALAEEVDGDYEYGAVSAPIGLAWGAGVLAILTALLPVVLQGGEEAFEEMKDRDFNTGADVLGKNRKR